MEIRQIEFEKLRHAYIVVKSFINEKGCVEVNSLSNKINAHHGLSGDDNLELLEEFVKKFELDYKNFKYDEHFYSEDELFGSGRAIVTLLTLSVWLPLKTIELLTFNKLNLNKPKLPVTPDRTVSDLTFKYMLTWYI